MTPYQRTIAELKAEPRKWLVTGAAGFIGSHLVETLLKLGQEVVGLDNFSTGSPLNLEDVRERVGEKAWERFESREGTVADMGACRESSNRVDYVLHQAGFVSVPLSIQDPIACHDTNVTGTLNLLVAARDNRVRRIVYASSSAVYGDDDGSRPKVESDPREPISPYGASKRMAEIYANQFTLHYGVETIGLRYFNVFGPRQNPVGGYAAVIPQWIHTLLEGRTCRIHGDGSNTRDFCPVENIVQANILAATTRERNAIGNFFNVAVGRTTSLNELYAKISRAVAELGVEPKEPEYTPPRAGDIAHSSAEVTAATQCLGYVPDVHLDDALAATVKWYAAADR